VVRAQEILAKYGVAADVCRSEIRRSSTRRARVRAVETCCIHRDAQSARSPSPEDEDGVFVAASDTCKVLADSSRLDAGRIRAIGTDVRQNEDRAAAALVIRGGTPSFVRLRCPVGVLKEGQAMQIVRRRFQGSGHPRRSQYGNIGSRLEVLKVRQGYRVVLWVERR